jgi:hypothetical protein
MRWVGHVACVGEGRNVYRVLVGKPEGKRPHERPRRRWQDVIKMDLSEIGWGCGVNSPCSGYGPLAGCCECGDEPSISGGMELVNIRKHVSICLRVLAHLYRKSTHNIKLLSSYLDKQLKP